MAVCCLFVSLGFFFVSQITRNIAGWNFMKQIRRWVLLKVRSIKF